MYNRHEEQKWQWMMWMVAGSTTTLIAYYYYIILGGALTNMQPAKYQAQSLFLISLIGMAMAFYFIGFASFWSE